MACEFISPTEWLLEISPSLQIRSWEKSQSYATPSSRWCAYINQICLDAILNWLKTEYVSEAAAWPNIAALSTFWEVINGTAISIGETRVVLIPSEVIDDSELEVPQEWVDIPSWAADYYLAVQVKPDEQCIRVWSYTTHKELKSRSSYDSVDRTYCMDRRYLTQDLSAFWIRYQFCQREENKAEITSLPILPATQAENLLQRLGSSSVTFPRLAVPFTIWGALLENEQWRQRLYQERLTFSHQGVNLCQWLLGIYSNGWEALETLFGKHSNNLAFSLRSESDITNTSLKRAKLIDLGIQIKSQSVVLLVALLPETETEVGIRVQLHPAHGKPYLPANVKLALLSESENLLQEVQARTEDSYVQLPRFDVQPGESFLIQVALDNFQITESFFI
ncbi:DUF1822 family protein [Nostoc sp. S13]|uniref:DUF1822 family protein n=1 Tax=Nostoc sp. S13 TaxID=3019266 RepID=UPI0026151F08|nr:DUF1822 family protein [Nostoc sp. S13]MDF5740353.1 DUF1822 family protein [Nostoc sp. S13]